MSLRRYGTTTADTDCWGPPIQINEHEIWSFPLTGIYPPKALSFIHCFNIKQKTLLPMSDFPYPLYFSANAECKFCYRPTTKDIFILIDEGNLIKVNVNSKQWSIIGYCPDYQPMFGEFPGDIIITNNNKFHLICQIIVKEHQNLDNQALIH